MPPVKIPHDLSLIKDAHSKWLKILKEAQVLVQNDIDMQDISAAGVRLKGRNMPPQVLGRIYAEYCLLINKMYDSYLDNLQLQRAPYMKEIVCVFVKRLYELRNELVHYIVNDYIYVDDALIQMKLTPNDIQIVVPYHYPLECRDESSELLLQRMWLDAVKRKKAALKMELPKKERRKPSSEEAIQDELEASDEEKDESEVESEHTIVSEDFIQATIIQRHERFRQFYMADFKAKCLDRRRYFVTNKPEAPMVLKTTAAKLIQKTYRAFMKIKRQRELDIKRDMMLGLVPDPWVEAKKYEEENNKMYERRRKKRSKLHEIFLNELEKEKLRLIVFKKEDQIDDITDEIREWFKEWYYGYGFFPEFPYEVEGGTLMVVRGDYPTVEEKIAADEKYLAETKGKTKDQLKEEKARAKEDAAMKAQIEREKQKKEAEQLLKMRCDPNADPGYEVKGSDARQGLIEVLQKYRSAWSFHDRCAPDRSAEVVYGFMQSLLTEELMQDIHVECRRYVDELMRLDLKLLIKMHQLMYKRVGWKYPKLKPRKKPKPPALPKPLVVNADLLKEFEPLFDLGIITKPTTKLKDVYGDTSYAAYDYNIRDPDASFPLPCYGDAKSRVMFSCVYGVGVNGANRVRAVMLLGPNRNGKSFLAEAAAGELNAVKIDITPQVFSAKIDEKPAKLLSKVLLAARVFQPAVIFIKNIEKVFAKKVLPQDIYLNAKGMKAPLTKLVKAISNDDKVIFIATCSDPLSANKNALLPLFSETILVPRTDYGTLQQFFYHKLQSIRSMPREYNVQALAQLLQGYGFGVLVELFDDVMNADRIVRLVIQVFCLIYGILRQSWTILNVTPLSSLEFMEPLVENNIEPLSIEDYQMYVDFFIQNHPFLNKERKEYEIINAYRDTVYKKMEEQRNKKKKEAA